VTARLAALALATMGRLHRRICIHDWSRLTWGQVVELAARECLCCGLFQIMAFGEWRTTDRSGVTNIRRTGNER
jgi:hypothetical protein